MSPREKPYDAVAEAYEKELGLSARLKQEELAATRHRCCGEWLDGPHHEACRKFVADAPPTVHESQETLC